MHGGTTTMVRLGFSPCPNDTFMFHGLVSGQVPVEGVSFYPVIEDIEALNQRAVTGRGALAMSKLSITALARAGGRFVALRSGAALGRGCGPLVVQRPGPGRAPDLAALAGATVAVPGIHTTAHLLLRMFGPPGLEVVPMRFDAIMPAVARGEVRAGVIIHEGRFTFAAHGLEALTDLGEHWERTTGLPLPLGLIGVARELVAPMIDALEHALRESVVLARREPRRSRTFVRQHAQEMDPDVCERHIALYVNDHSEDVGEEGRAAIDELFARGRAVGMIDPAARSPWR